MKTKEVLERMPEKIRFYIEYYKNRYKALDDGTESGYVRRNALRLEANAYLRGLRDGGLITDREKQTLFCYITYGILDTERNKGGHSNDEINLALGSD